MMTPDERARHDFEQVAVHEVAHALLAAHCSPRLTIWRNPSRDTVAEKTYLGSVTLCGHSTPPISIGGELANYLYDLFRCESESDDVEWPEDFTFWSDDFIDTFNMDEAGGSVSDSDLEGLRELSFDERCQLAEEVADELRNLWPDLLRIVRTLVEQFEEDPTEECYGFTDWEMKQLL